MSKKLLTVLAIFGFLSIPTAQAALALSVASVPPAVDADTYTLKITTAPGAKVTVTGGMTELPPQTDSNNDGKVEITVGLVQESKNTFSIRAEKGTESSETVQIVIKESKAEAEAYAQETGADITPPEKPILNSYLSEVNADSITLTGKTEAAATVIAAKTDGTQITTSLAKSDGTFSLKIILEQNVRNRINISARDKTGNTSNAVQAVIVESDNAPVLLDAETTASSFTDIVNHWAKNYIEILSQKGIVSGKSTGIFAPDDYLTRAELTKIALKTFGVQTENVTQTSFGDVKLADWFAPYVEKAKKSGIIQGYADGFRPNQSITRAEALKILLVTAGFEIPAASADFSDVESNAWYAQYVAFAKNNNIVGGYSDGTFRPNQPVTRGEIAKITVKILELFEAQQAIETENSTGSGSTTETGTGALLENQSLYENTHYHFSLQYYKNWYYENVAGSGSVITATGFSDQQDAYTNALAMVELRQGSLASVGKTDGASETNGGVTKYFVKYNDTNHFEIYGNETYADKIKIMAETLAVQN